MKTGFDCCLINRKPCPFAIGIYQVKGMKTNKLGCVQYPEKDGIPHHTAVRCKLWNSPPRGNIIGTWPGSMPLTA